MNFVAARIIGPVDTHVKLSLLRRTFLKGTSAERRRQFVVTVTRKSPLFPDSNGMFLCGCVSVCLHSCARASCKHALHTVSISC